MYLADHHGAHCTATNITRDVAPPQQIQTRYRFCWLFEQNFAVRSNK